MAAYIGIAQTSAHPPPITGLFQPTTCCRHVGPAGLTGRYPDLADADNPRYLQAIENAKRRLVSRLLAMNLPPRSRFSEDDPEHGVAFDLLHSPAKGSRVLTGHASRLITLNVEEADDAKREKIRNELHEPVGQAFLTNRATSRVPDTTRGGSRSFRGP